MANDEVADWLEGVVKRDQATAQTPATRPEIITELMSANTAAKRLRGTIYHARAHKYVNELLNQLVGL